MLSFYFLKEEICATCEFWGVKRVKYSNFVMLMGEEGRCKNTKGFNGLKTLEMSKCQCWELIDNGDEKGKN
ncbi:hypothetical protein [Desnuesiella massiliensis]|uniref:hypothetical protein n=1 Tax=Desnuesiella massiliensis TaxID=1650662 RepID=UPI0006E44286|nr:hypothetical protein [Desnuesiella massiliensis]